MLAAALYYAKPVPPATGGGGGPFTCAAPVPIQTASVSMIGPSDHPTQIVTLPVPVTPGNSVAIIIGSDQPIVSADGAGGTYTVRQRGLVTGYAGFAYASAVPGTGSAFTVHFDLSGGNNYNGFVVAMEIPGPVTEAAYDWADSQTDEIRSPSLPLDDCGIWLASYPMGDPIDSGPDNGWTGAQDDSGYWGAAWLAADDHATHDSAYTIGASKPGAALGLVLVADANLVAGGASVPCTAPVIVQTATPVITRATADNFDIVFPSNVTPGNSVIVGVSGAAQRVDSASGLGGTWSIDGQVDDDATIWGLGILHASDVVGGDDTVNVQFAAGTSLAYLVAIEVEGPITAVGNFDVLEDGSSHATLASPSLNDDSCRVDFFVGYEYNAAVSAGPSGGFSGAASADGSDHYAYAYLASEDHAAHSTTFTIATANIGGAIVGASFASSAGGGGGGGGGGLGSADSITPLWMGVGTQGGNISDFHKLMAGTNGYTSIDATTVLNACGAIDQSYSHAWRDGLNVGSSGGLASSNAADAATALGLGFSLGIGGHLAHGSGTGPPTLAEIDAWIDGYIDDFINYAAANGYDRFVADLEPYGDSNPAGAWDGYSDAPSAWYDAGLRIGAKLVAAGLAMDLYGSSNFNVPNSNNWEILTQQLGAAPYYADCRAIGIMAGLNDSGAEITWLDASFHYGPQNDLVADWAEGIARYRSLGEALHPDIDHNAMAWPDNNENGHTPFSGAEVQEAVEAMLAQGTGRGVIYDHNAVEVEDTDYETEWHDDYFPAIQAGRGL